jgi:hypothetical protein
MKLDNSLEPFRAAIESLQRLLHKFNDRGVIIGGVAVGFLGKPRFTADIDAVFHKRHPSFSCTRSGGKHSSSH